MVGFCDLVGTGIEPVSTKSAVKVYFKPSRKTKDFVFLPVPILPGWLKILHLIEILKVAYQLKRKCVKLGCGFKKSQCTSASFLGAKFLATTTSCASALAV